MSILRQLDNIIEETTRNYRGQAPGSDCGQSPGSNRGQSPGSDCGQSPESNRGQSPGSDCGQSPESDRGQSPESNRGQNPRDGFAQPVAGEMNSLLELQSAFAKGGNLLVQGDNLAVMRALLDGGGEGTFQCLYLDPPFYSGSNYAATVPLKSEKANVDMNLKVRAYEDVWPEGPASYYRWLCETVLLSRDLLKDTGVFWLHLDWHSVHYAKVLLDCIFGEENFVNEIVWQYKSGGASGKRFARKHDTILLYAKTDAYSLQVGKEKSYNRGLKPYHFKEVEEFQDEIGWYTMVNQKDVWSIDMVGRTSRERTGYATQKPRELLERILVSSSAEGDLVGDFCCGSGGFPLAAGRLGRRLIGCDRSPLAIAISEKQLLDEGVEYEVVLPDTPLPGAMPVHVGALPKVQAIKENDPESLVLFKKKRADGKTETVDVFGNRTID